MKFAAKLKDLIGPRWGAQAELARGTGIDPSAINRLLHGGAQPTTEQIFLIARHYKVPMEYLYDEAMVEIPVPDPLPIDPWFIRTILDLGEPQARRRLLAGDVPRRTPVTGNSGDPQPEPADDSRTG